jgi:hypothetical protein
MLGFDRIGSLIECRDINTCLDSADSLLYIIFNTYNIKRITYILFQKLDI